MATKRSDAYAIWYMPEDTYGVDPGIVAAVNNGDIVNGVHEDYKYVPMSGYAAYARIINGVEGLPRRPMVEAEQVHPVTDNDNFRAKGLKGGGNTFSFEMHCIGGILDTVGTDTDRPIPPPWRQLAGSASGRCIGHRATDSGGGNGATNNSVVAAAAPVPAAHQFTIEAGAGTVGVLAPGHVFGVDHGTGGAPDIELVRPNRCEADETFGDVTAGAVSATTSGAWYNGASVAFKAAPAAADRVYFSSQTNFDRRYEDSGGFGSSEDQLSFTVLVLRPEVESCQILTGVRCNEFEITSNTGELDKIKLTFHYKLFKTAGDDGATAFGGTPAITDEPAYYAEWPCPKVNAGSNLTFLKYYDSNEDGTYNTPVVVRGNDEDTPANSLPITNMTISWKAGYTVRHSNMATEGVEDLRQTERQSLEIKFTTLYYDDWRDMLGLCNAVTTNGYNTFPFIYWTGELRSQIWFIACPSLHIKEDPGPGDTDFEGNQAQEIMLGMRPYRGDLDSTGAAESTFSTTTTDQNRFALGTL